VNWLENNPLGLALASACAVLVLISAALLYAWSRPAPTHVVEPGDASVGTTQIAELTDDLGPLSEYRVVTDRPVFEENRRPVVVTGDEELAAEEETDQVGEAPEVRLTGVVITPELKMVTLKPLNAGETMIAIEGRPLEGENAGWTVQEINPRQIVLAADDGRSLALDLEVNTRKIAEPPKPAPPPPETTQQSPEGDEDEPLSRAEEIRQRIAERREELRREQEANEQANPANQRSAYQEAIQQMMRRNSSKDEDEDP
jgi:hypothetical protein